MTKSDMIELIGNNLKHLPIKEVEMIINTIFDKMTDSLMKGDRIEIRGFGSFEVRVREPRQGRNPKTGASIVTFTSPRSRLV